ncbi:MAG: RHS repeat protein, partial [Verrucomicrobia bacterium]|nr:RHS repeat protein [Verrucomicrobiota bacterium]
MNKDCLLRRVHTPLAQTQGPKRSIRYIKCGLTVFGMIALLLKCVAVAQQGCGLSVTVQTKTRWANKSKCGILGGCADVSPLKCFMRRDIHCESSWIWYGPPQDVLQANTQQTYTYSEPYCNGVLTCSGTASHTLGGTNLCADQVLSDCSWADGCGLLVLEMLDDVLDDAQYQVTQCDAYTGKSEYHYSDESQQIDSVITDAWSNEYTDEMLRAAIIAAMPSFPSEWTADSHARASFQMDDLHYQGSGNQMLYRLKITGTEAGVTYKLAWQEVTVYPDGTSKAVSLEEYVTANGPEVFSSVYQVDPPPWQCNCPSGGTATTTVENIAPPEIVSSTAGGGGGGGGGGTGSAEPGSGGVCGSDSASGAKSGPVTCVRAPCNPKQDPCNGVSLTVSMGAASLGMPAGNLYLSEQVPSVNLAQPGLLRFSGTSADVEVIKLDDVLRQLKAPQALADIQTINQFKYEIRFYRLTDVGPKVGDTYQILNPTNWFTKWTIENPDASTNTYNRLGITQSRQGESKTWMYTFDPQTVCWSLNHPGNLRQDRWQIVHDASTRQYIASVRIPNGSDVLKSTSKYRMFDWGEGLVEQTVGDGSNQRTTTFHYYDNPGFVPNGTSLPLKLVIPHDGPWQRYDSYDQQGRPLVVVSQFLNAPTNTNDSYCYRTDYDYTPISGTGDDGSQPHIPRTTVQYLLGHEIGRSYTIIKPGEIRHIQCQTPGAAWNASDNLVTVRTFYTSGTFTNYPRTTDNPDGTRQVFFYNRSGSGTNATQTTVVLAGQKDSANATNILSGTVTTTVVGHLGQTLSRTVQDKSSALILAQETYQYLDEFYHSYTVTRLNGTAETYQYGCCGLDIWTDTDGRQNQYLYDTMGRQIGSAVLSFNPLLMTTNQLDAAGQVLRTVRTGGALTIVTAQFAYNNAGETIAETNALGGVTTYTESTDAQGQRIRTTTYPDGGTRIELYYLDGQLAKLTGTAVNPVRYEYGVEQDNNTWRIFRKEIKLDANYADTSEWTKTYADMLGRDYKTVFAAASTPYPYRQSFYNNPGQLWKERDPDGVVTLYGYNPKGELAYRVIDVNTNNTIDFNGTDRITWTTNDVTTYSGYNVTRTRTIVYTTNNSTETITNAMTLTSTSGLKTWSIVYRDGSTPVTTTTETVYGANGTRTVTTTNPDGSSVVRTFSYGRLQSEVRKDSSGNTIGSTTYSYDAHGRVSATTDARNGTTYYAYNNADQVTSTTAPSLGTGEPQQVTLTFYDTLGRVTGTQLPDGSTTTNFYYQSGLLQKTSGSRIYPVEYTYDAQGRMRTMKTWQDFAGNTGTATTRWNYDPYRGWLKSKDYPDASSGQPPAQEGTGGPVYTYTSAGRLATRVWKRGVTTTYSYNNAGDLQTIDYSDSTPDVSYTYDRRGRRLTAICNGITTTLTYNDANQPLTESYSGGTLAGLSMNWTYDNKLRLSTVTAKNGATALQSAAYSYDAAGRLQTVTDSPYSATYTYHPNSTLINTITFANNGAIRLVASRVYDKLNRLTLISSAASGASAPSMPVSFAYQYNAANQRTRMNLADGSFWEYRYDALGQVVSGKRYWPDGTAVAGQQFEYRFDDIGNRKTTAVGGNESGSGLRGATYTANRLNQYSSRTVPAYVDILGIANPTAGVTVNGNTAQYRRGEYFHHALNVPNSTAQYPTVTVVSQYGGGQTETGKVYVPPATESFTHDADGNLTSDGRWTYSWDAENRL